MCLSNQKQNPCQYIWCFCNNASPMQIVCVDRVCAEHQVDPISCGCVGRYAQCAIAFVGGSLFPSGRGHNVVGVRPSLGCVLSWRQHFHDSMDNAYCHPSLQRQSFTWMKCSANQVASWLFCSVVSSCCARFSLIRDLIWRYIFLRAIPCSYGCYWARRLRRQLRSVLWFADSTLAHSRWSSLSPSMDIDFAALIKKNSSLRWSFTSVGIDITWFGISCKLDKTLYRWNQVICKYSLDRIADIQIPNPGRMFCFEICKQLQRMFIIETVWLDVSQTAWIVRKKCAHSIYHA